MRYCHLNTSLFIMYLNRTNVLIMAAVTAQLVERPTKKPGRNTESGSCLRDFSPESTFSADSNGVRTAAVCNRMH